MNYRNLCKKVLSFSAVLAFATLSQVSAISLAEIEQNPERYGNASATSEYAYYVDLDATRIVSKTPPTFAIDGQLIYVDYETKEIKDTYATMYYDRSQSMEEVQKNVLEQIKKDYTREQLVEMGREGFDNLFAEKLQEYLYDNPQVALQINGTHTYTFDGQLKEGADEANQNLSTLRRPNAVPFGGDSYILALMMYEKAFGKPFYAN